MNLRTSETGEQTPPVAEMTAGAPLSSNYPRCNLTSQQSVVLSIGEVLIMLVIASFSMWGLSEVFDSLFQNRCGAFGAGYALQLVNILFGWNLLVRFKKHKLVVCSLLGLFQLIFLSTFLKTPNYNELLSDPRWPQEYAWVPIGSIFVGLGLVQLGLLVATIKKNDLI